MPVRRRLRPADPGPAIGVRRVHRGVWAVFVNGARVGRVRASTDVNALRKAQATLRDVLSMAETYGWSNDPDSVDAP